MKHAPIIAALILGVLIGHFAHKDRNAELRDGTGGTTENCRAIIKAAVDGYNSNQYSAEDALASINRNCGEFGYSWSD